MGLKLVAMPRFLALGILIAGCSGGLQSSTTSVPQSSTAASPASAGSTDGSTVSSQPSTSVTTLAPLQRLEYLPVATNLPFPVQVTALPGSDTAYVATKDGRVWALVDGSLVDEPVLDITERVRDSGEQGLLALALHPSSPERLFVHYSGVGGDTVVSEFDMTSPLAADPESETILFEIGQPAANHNGGMIQFGPQGLLFLGLGDGGGANDAFGNGQNTDTLLGGLALIDPDGGAVSQYGYGLRNPWRFWIDGDLIYIADVGQNAFEEVSVAELGEGLNFGWPITEGLHCFKPSTGCDTGGLTLPVVEVEHGDAGTCSITGGLVYFGAEIPEIAGQYFYSDYCGGYLRSFSYVGGTLVTETDWTDQVGVPGRVTGFGHDGRGEMYVTTQTDVFLITAVR